MSGIIANGIFTIIGAIIGFVGSWIVSKRIIKQTNLDSLALNRIQERDKAAATFRLAFLELILFLKNDIEPEGFTDFVSFLHNLYPKHAAAVVTFTPYLNKSGIARINKAWFDYCFPDGITEDEYQKGKKAFPLDDYAHISEPQKVALEKIETLLSIGIHNKKSLWLGGRAKLTNWN